LAEKLEILIYLFSVIYLSVSRLAAIMGLPYELLLCIGLLSRNSDMKLRWKKYDVVFLSEAFILCTLAVLVIIFLIACQLNYPY
jgi:hypothetical protein